MSTDSHIPHDDAEREWQAQERAMRHERQGIDARLDDDATRRYRAIARALAQPPEYGLPADFARRVARAASSSDVDARLEQALIYLLGTVMGIVSIAAIAVYGVPAWPSLASAVPVDLLTNRWLLALAGCALVSVAIQRWRPAR
jgi:hypothetical protein